MTKKVLRIGVIHSGRLIDEFTINKDKKVTLGSSIKNNIVIKSKRIPNKYKLFTLKNDKVTLHISNTMEAEIVDKKNKNKYQDKSISISLTDKDIGKIKIDNDIKVLFQFIPPHEENHIPKKIPPQFRNKAKNYFDLRIFIPLAISMILHIIWIISMQTMEYSSAPLSINEIPNRFQSLIIQEPEKEKMIAIKPKDDPKGKSVGVIRESPIQKKASKKASISEKDTNEDAKKIAAKKSVRKKSRVLKALHEINKNGGSFTGINDEAMENGSETVSLSDIYNNQGNKASKNDYRSDYGTNSTGRRGSGIAGRSMGISRKTSSKLNNSLSSLNTNIGNNRKELKVKKTKKVAIKSNKSKLEVKIPNNGRLTQKNARRAISKTKRQVNRCYQQQAKKNNSFAGRVTVVITIGDIGNSLNVAIKNARMNDKELTGLLSRCIQRKLKRITYPIPEKAPINIKFTAVFSAGQ